MRVVLWLFYLIFFQKRRLRLKEVNLFKDTQLVSSLARYEFSGLTQEPQELAIVLSTLVVAGHLL